MRKKINPIKEEHRKSLQDLDLFKQEDETDFDRYYALKDELQFVDKQRSKQIFSNNYKEQMLLLALSNRLSSEISQLGQRFLVTPASRLKPGVISQINRLEDRKTELNEVDPLEKLLTMLDASRLEDEPV